MAEKLRLKISESAVIETPNGVEIGIIIDQTKRIPQCSVKVKNPRGHFVQLRHPNVSNMQISWGGAGDVAASATALKVSDLSQNRLGRFLETKGLFAIFNGNEELIGLVKNT